MSYELYLSFFMKTDWCIFKGYVPHHLLMWMFRINGVAPICIIDS